MAGPVAGLLLVDKPTGMTSTDVVRVARRVFRTRRVGHAGTLDPDASGLLLVCIGACTKAVPYLMATRKRYETDVVLGSETLTDDAEGDVIREAAWEHVQEPAVRAFLEQATGEVQQVPPRVCALKRGGRRMHERVRAGEDVEGELEPRSVLAFSLELLRWEPPKLTLALEVGKGYYVRSLARDLGRALGSAAHVTRLRRTQSGNFDVAHAVSVDEMAEEALLSIEEALAHLPAAHAGAEAAWRITNGQRVRVGDDLTLEGTPAPGTAVRVLGPDGLLAVAELDDEGRVKVRRGFHSDPIRLPRSNPDAPPSDRS